MTEKATTSVGAHRGKWSGLPRRHIVAHDSRSSNKPRPRIGVGLPTKRLRKRLGFAVRIILGIGLLYIVLSKTGGWHNIGLLANNPSLLVFIIALPITGAAIEAIRLGILARALEMHIPFGSGYRVVAIGTFFNFAIPGGTGGDVMKAYCLSTYNRGHGMEVATLVVVDRAVALFAWLTMIALLALVNLQLVAEYATIRWLILGTLFGMVGLILLAAVVGSDRIRSSRLQVYLTSEAPLKRRLKRVSDALYEFRGHKLALFMAAFLSFLGHTVLAGMFLTVGRVLIPDGSGLVISLLAFLSMLANALPVTPGGLGVGEAAFAGLFGLVGYAGGAQLILAWRFGMLPLCAIGAGLYILGAYGSRHSLARDLQLRS